MILGAGLRREQDGPSEKLIRLHVVANSDSEADQALKLECATAVMKRPAGCSEGVTDRGEAVRRIEENLDAVTAGARDVVLENGYDYEVTAQIAVEAFPTREYETFSLPVRGVYVAARRDRRGRRAQTVVRHLPAAVPVGRLGREDVLRAADAPRRSG